VSLRVVFDDAVSHTWTGLEAGFSTRFVEIGPASRIAGRFMSFPEYRTKFGTPIAEAIT
jgi:hypothetical protein